MNEGRVENEMFFEALGRVVYSAEWLRIHTEAIILGMMSGADGIQCLTTEYTMAETINAVRTLADRLVKGKKELATLLEYDG